jgi:hypothetical protein
VAQVEVELAKISICQGHLELPTKVFKVEQEWVLLQTLWAVVVVVLEAHQLEHHLTKLAMVV